MSAIEPKRACQQRLSVLNKSHEAARVLKITKTVVPRQHPAKFARPPKICRPCSQPIISSNFQFIRTATLGIAV